MNEPQKYRKKPVVIEAMRHTGHATGHAIVDWIEGWTETEKDDEPGGEAAYFSPASGTVAIDTLEGVMHASIGDYVIRGVEGEFYPCKPAIFDATYEPVERGEGDHAR